MLGNHLTVNHPNMPIPMHQRGHRQVDITEMLGMTQSVISRTISCFRHTDMITRRPGSRSRKIKTPQQDRFLVLNVGMRPFSETQ